MLRLSRREPSYLYHTVNYDDNMKKYVIDDEKLLNEWIKDKNLPLTPKDITKSSGKKVWWRCDKGHEWEESVSNRRKGYGCSYCSHHKLLIGETDLETINPQLSKEFNYNRNYPLIPSQVFTYSNKKI